MKWFFAFLLFAATFLAADSAWAWGPAAHLHFGILLLEQVPRLAQATAALLTEHTASFLYGCVSADIVLAKRLGRAMTHCHNWDSGLRMVHQAPGPRLKAFSFGYMAHLAADAIGHNCFVPSKTIESYDSGVMKHLYWELLFDRRVVSPLTVSWLKHIAREDFSDCDQFLDSLIATRVFDFSTNKRIFDQLLMLQGMHQWQKLVSQISRKTPWPLLRKEIDGYTQRCVDAIFSFLSKDQESDYLRVDPTGRERLQAANRLRRMFKKQLIREQPPASGAVQLAVQSFAQEPFKKLNVEDFLFQSNP